MLWPLCLMSDFNDPQRQVHNVTFEDITLDSEELGITLKTARGRGGEVSGITYRRIKGNGVGGAAIQVCSRPRVPGSCAASPRLCSVLLLPPSVPPLSLALLCTSSLLTALVPLLDDRHSNASMLTPPESA